MKFIYTLLLTVLYKLSVAQFAVIDDKDGFSNVRKTAESGNNIQDKLENGHFVYCMDTQGNWVNVDYDLKTQSNNGFVYKDRLKLVTSFEKVGVVSKGTTSSVFKNDSFTVTVTSQPFDKSKNDLTYLTYQNNTGIHVETINGKHCWGIDGNVPKQEYKSITLLWGHKIVEVPKNAIENLFEPHVERVQVNYDRANNVLYIQTDGGDGAGGYEVAWKIVNGVYKERYVAYGF